MNRNAVHIALTVHDLQASIDFYEVLFGETPAKQRADYAKFEAHTPSLALSLNPGRPGSNSAAHHFGLRLEAPNALDAIRERLTGADIPQRVEEDVTCCYARANKIWVQDPDGNDWELYEWLADTAERGDQTEELSN